VAIGIEATIRNSNLGILVKASLFPAVVGVIDPIGDGMFFVALLYGGAALFVALPLILVSRRRFAPPPTEPDAPPNPPPGVQSGR
jgi:BASS family bile acid:Na+ symporter